MNRQHRDTLVEFAQHCRERQKSLRELQGRENTLTAIGVIDQAINHYRRAEEALNEAVALYDEVRAS